MEIMRENLPQGMPGGVVSRVTVSIDVKDVFNFGTRISEEVVQQLSDIIADDLAARKADEILACIDVDRIAGETERKITAALGVVIIRELLGKYIAEGVELNDILSNLHDIYL